MTTATTTKPAVNADGTFGTYAVFSITFGVIACILYLFVMNYGWQLFTYYPKTNQWMLFNHPPVGGAAAGPAMKWYGYVATDLLGGAVAGVIASLIGEKNLRAVWWPGMIWVVPVVCTVVLFYLIVYVGD
jgi:hypothetical protein